MNEHRTPMVVIPDPLSARTFFDCAILEKLKERVDEYTVVFTGDRYDYSRWTRIGPAVEYITDSALEEGRKPAFLKRIHRYIDRWLDGVIGWHPLAIRLNLQHGFHTERMLPNHNNKYLDTNLVGPLPRWGWIYSLMFKWVFNKSRYIEEGILDLVRNRCSVLVMANLQAPRMYKYVVAARKYNIPMISYIASWDHTVGKGVVYPLCDKFLVQNTTMKNDLVKYHDIVEDRIVVTGWPQSDIFAGSRSDKQYRELVKSFGLDPDKRVILVTGNTRTNAPYEPKFLERFVEWVNEEKLDVSVVFRPHPKDKGWRDRFANARKRMPDLYYQPASYTDVEDLACLLQHVDCVVTHAGTILLDSIVNGRPAVCVIYDESPDTDIRFADKNVIGLHYQELMSSGAFHVARSLEDVKHGVRNCLSDPGALESQRIAIVRRVVGEVDGKAADRVVDAILD